MSYRNKEDCIKEAERLGLDVKGMGWSELQKTVSDALKMEELGVLNTRKAPISEEKAENRQPQKKRPQVDVDADALKQFYGQTIVMSPELLPERYRLVKYDEDLGSELEVVERKFDINPETGAVYDVAGGEVNHENQVDEYHDYTTGTYRIKQRSERRVTGMASVPKENPGLSFRPGIDLCTVVSFKGKHGYLWKHWTYPNVSALLKAAGDEYYQKYRKVFKDSPNVWYACGHLVCDPYLVHQVLQEIQEDAKSKREMAEARKRAAGGEVPRW